MAAETNSKESKKEDNNDIAFRNDAITAIKGLVHENKKLRDVVAQRANEKKGASSPKQTSASRPRGLRGFTGQLGTQTKV